MALGLSGYLPDQWHLSFIILTFGSRNEAYSSIVSINS